MKVLLTIILSFFCLTSMGQEKVIYVVFTHNADTVGIRHLPTNGKYDTSKFRCENHYFSAVNKEVGFYRIYIYINPINLPDNPVLIKSTSFLNTVEYIDWDVYTKDFTLQQYKTLIETLDTYDKVYFIDRSEIKDGMMRMYPVKEFKPNF